MTDPLTEGETGEASKSPTFPTGSTVLFPYAQPYPQQVALMDALLDSLKLRQETLDQQKEDQNSGSRNFAKKKSQCPVYLLESPTGTGKSLSLACASLAWLHHAEARDLTAPPPLEVKTAGETSASAWMDSYIPAHVREKREHAERIRTTALKARTQLQSVLHEMKQQNGAIRRPVAVRTAVTDARAALLGSNRKKRARIAEKPSPIPADPYRLDDYPSEDEGGNRHHNCDDENEDGNHYSSKSMSTASKILHGPTLDGSAVTDTNSSASVNSTVGGVAPGTGVRKILYAARTHSQLSQFVGELKRADPQVRVVALGGRSVLCGHADLRKKHPSEAALNEACLDLQKTSGGGCPLKNKAAVDTLALHTLAQPTDIEEAASLGASSQACAYYASRSALAAAQVVVLPYSLLLSPQARQSIGLSSIEQSLVILDEAHNVPEAIRALFASRLSLAVIQSALKQLQGYTERYATRLAGRNVFYLGQIRRILLQFQKYLKKPPADEASANNTTSGMITPDEFMMNRKLANVNLFKLLRYMERSRLSQKLLGFNQSKDVAPTDQGPSQTAPELSKHISAMSLVQSFLDKLTTNADQGKIVTDWPTNMVETARAGGKRRVEQAQLRFVLLEPAAFLKPLLQQAHAVAMVGGTLRPFVHVATELLDDESTLSAAAQADQAIRLSQKECHQTSITPNLTTFCCGHVVPASNVLLQCLDKGPTGTTLDLRHAARSTAAVLDEVGRTLEETCRKVPHGVVVFLPSYSYEATLVRRWKTSGQWKRLEELKSLHREPKSSSQVEATLQLYAKDALRQSSNNSVGGAMLFSVVGGKLSEGINFANDMARAVVVVGLPYPDLMDPELVEKMTALDRGAGGVSGKAYYHNLCMRAVNQSVGRAIRHAKDYAAVMLLDRRYVTDARVHRGLPEWLKRGDGWNRPTSFVGRMQELTEFFRAKAKDNAL